MTLSDRGLRFIARWEGYRRYPYNDAAGYATIGYGHLLHESPVTVRDRLRYPAGLTVRQALRLLRRDCLAAQQAVQRLTAKGRRLSQHEFDALCSFAFNCGGGALAHSSLIRDATAHAVVPDLIRHDFQRWSHAGGVELPGLLRRRNEEADVFLHGIYHDGGNR